MTEDLRRADRGFAPSPEFACSLGSVKFKERLAWIRSLARRALLSRRREGLRLTLRYRASAASEVRELVEMERQCCAFLDFELGEDSGRILLTIIAPESAIDAAEAIFSEFGG